MENSIFRFIKTAESKYVLHDISKSKTETIEVIGNVTSQNEKKIKKYVTLFCLSPNMLKAILDLEILISSKERCPFCDMKVTHLDDCIYNKIRCIIDEYYGNEMP